MSCATLGRAGILAVAALVVSSGLSRAAGAINISPTRLELNAHSRYTSFTLTNPGNQPVLFQIEARAWTQKNGGDLLMPTTGLIVAPPVVSIDAGTSRVVRVALRDVAPSEREQTYRLLITQVVDKMKTPGLRFIYQLNVPLFVTPASAAETKLVWSARLDRRRKRIAVSLENAGNVHFRVDEVAVLGGFGGNVPLGELKDPGDVLAGATHVYDVPIRGMPEGSAITVEASAGGQPTIRTVVSLPP